MRYSLRDLCYAFLFITVCLIGCSLGAGGGTPTPEPQAGEIQQINALIDTFQTSYSAKDYQGLRGTFHPKANVAIDFSGSVFQSTFTINEWILQTEALLKDKRSVSDVLSNREIVVYRNIATVVADYDYQADGDRQVGQDIMTLVKFNGSWKIWSLAFYGDPAK